MQRLHVCIGGVGLHNVGCPLVQTALEAHTDAAPGPCNKTLPIYLYSAATPFSLALTPRTIEHNPHRTDCRVASVAPPCVPPNASPLLQALGPVTDAGVAVKQHMGLFPNIKITTNKAASSSSSGSASIGKAVSFMPHISVKSTPVAAPVSHGGKSHSFKIGGRKLAQACDSSQKVSTMRFDHSLTTL